MAVKKDGEMYAILLDFLSRLCGGEETSIQGQAHGLFLSRLCGGEARNLPIAKPTHFLSRLCGGEARIRQKL